LYDIRKAVAERQLALVRGGSNGGARDVFLHTESYQCVLDAISGCHGAYLSLCSAGERLNMNDAFDDVTTCLESWIWRETRLEDVNALNEK
jgi:hypothetical protein